MRKYLFIQFVLLFTLVILPVFSAQATSPTQADQCCFQVGFSDYDPAEAEQYCKDLNLTTKAQCDARAQEKTTARITLGLIITIPLGAGIFFLIKHIKRKKEN